MDAWASSIAALREDNMQRLHALDQLQELASAHGASREQLLALLDESEQLLAESNYKVALKTLQVWEAAVRRAAAESRPLYAKLLPSVVERLGDGHQDVRQAACNLMLEALQCHVLRPELTLAKLSRFWEHKSWKVRHGLLQFVAEAVCTLGEEALAARDPDHTRELIGHVVGLVEDPESAVRDAAAECLEEVYRVVGEPLVDAVAARGLRPARLAEIYGRLGLPAGRPGADGAAGDAAAEAGVEAEQGEGPGAAGAELAGAGEGAAAAGEAAAEADAEPAAGEGAGAADAAAAAAEAEAAVAEAQAEAAAAEPLADAAAAEAEAAAAAAAAAAATPEAVVQTLRAPKAGRAKPRVDVAAASPAAGPAPAASPAKTPAKSPAGKSPGSAARRGGRPAAARTLSSPPSRGAARAAASASAPASPGAAGASPAVRRAASQRAAAAAAAAALPPAPAPAQQRARPAAAPAARRGGYMDGGGVSVAGALPPAPEISVASERELASHLDRVAAVFAITNATGGAEWTDRIGAMLTLEGLARGGAAAAHPEAFDDALRALRQRLAEQLLDRRSAVSRQACHLLGVLSESLGQRLDGFVAAVLPMLFKLLIITVQVVADAADVAARRLVAAHRAPKVAAAVVEALSGEKSAKLRQYCAAYLQEILEGWPHADYASTQEALEAALIRALGDNLTTTRAAARAALQAYRAAAPERAAALLAKCDPSLRAKLEGAAGGAGTGAGAGAHEKGAPKGGAAGAAAAPPRRAGGARDWARERARLVAAARSSGGGGDEVEVIVVAPPRGPPARVSSDAAADAPAVAPAAEAAAEAPAGPSSAPAPAAPAPAPAPPAADAAPPARPVAPRPRKSLASGVPLRVLGAGSVGAGGLGGLGLGGGSLLDSREPGVLAAAERTAEAPSTAAPGSRGRRTSVAPQRVPQPQLAGPTPGKALRPATSHEPSAPAGRAAAPQQAPAPAAGGGMARAASAPLPCGVADDAVAAAAAGAPAAARPAVARAAAAVMAATAASDWKERIARLDALSEALMEQSEAPGGLSPADLSEVERALPRLMAAADDGHFKISLAALAATRAVLCAAPRAAEPGLDKLMPLLFLRLHALKESVRGAAEGALAECAARFGADALLAALVRALDAMKQPTAKVSVMEFCVGNLGPGRPAGAPSHSLHLRQWVSRNLGLLLDKNPVVRRGAARVLADLNESEPAFVSACLQSAPEAEATAFERAVGPAAPPPPPGAGASGGTRPGSGCPSPAAARGGVGAASRSPSGRRGGAAAVAPRAEVSEAATAEAAASGGDEVGAVGPAVAEAGPAAVAPRAPAAPAAEGLSGPAEAVEAPAPTAADSDAPSTEAAAPRVEAGRDEAAEEEGPEPLALAGVELPPDPAAQARHLLVLIHRLRQGKGPADAEAALSELSACCAPGPGGAGDEAWASAAADAVPAALDAAAAAAAGDAAVRARAAAFELLGRLAARGWAAAAAAAPGGGGALLGALLGGCADGAPEAAAAARDALDAAVDAAPIGEALGCVRALLPRGGQAPAEGAEPDSPALAAAIRAAGRALSRAPPATAAAAAAPLLPGLVATLQRGERADARRAAVVCLAELAARCGESVAPPLEPLEAGERKLLDAYQGRRAPGAPAVV
ncbi:hypothetical protein Rsub_04913 [Raphidocelis subcapitata]|uniref:TOG domain-containing protein n=1 Tax=Raphidocelis subcapitata TaxID=307507 RepID=A0A2V0NVY5_9CHLO|nr:hypothetical protein Rsub_04913 [Raphidocelis subcapitata]|eukprot:GBF91808.1 hypothetical protein Rsub_04913 [Raphidocelis subcapitata]